MKKFFSYAILLFLAAMYMAGCGSGSNTKTAEAVPMTVDSLLAAVNKNGQDATTAAEEAQAAALQAIADMQ